MKLGGELTLEVTGSTIFGSDWVENWNHVAITRESSDGSIHLYLNGVETTRTSGVVGSVTDNDITSTNGGWIVHWRYIPRYYRKSQL